MIVRGLPNASAKTWILVLRPPLLFPIAWSSPAFFGASAVLMGSHNGTVDHRVFVVRVDSQQGKDGAPYATFRPTAPSAVGIVPISKALGKVTPGDTGAVPVYHRVDEPAVIG